MRIVKYELLFCRVCVFAGLVFLFSACSGGKKTVHVKDNKKEYKYFRIYANADDDILFVKLQDELDIEPKMEVYTIVVDIRDKTLEPYVLFGDIDESSPKRFSWTKLSNDVQQGLINWSGSNKERLE
jgi:hypothetical protein